MVENTPQNVKILRKNINALLVAFTKESLKPSDSFKSRGTDLLQNVFTFLERREHRLSIGKKEYGGSVGKSTSVIFPDFDCVVFLNKLPPHNESVQKIRGILQRNADALHINLATMSSNDKTVSFEFLNGVEVDLLPATNFSQNCKETQYEMVLRKLRETTDDNLKAAYSSSLAQIQVEFLWCQPGAVNELTRLAKYWFKLCTLYGKIHGGSSIMEILSVDVAWDMDPEGNGRSFKILDAFKELLNRVTKIKTLKIAFYRETENFWEKANFSLSAHRNHFDQNIIASENFIIEPANPYNDLARNIDDFNANMLKTFAEKMLDRLDDLESLESNDIKSTSKIRNDIHVEIHFEKLFEPFFVRLKEFYPNFAVPIYIWIDYKYQRDELAQVQDKVREDLVPYFNDNKQKKYAYKAVMNILKFLIWGNAVRTFNGGLSFYNGIVNVSNTGIVKSAVKMFTDANFGVKKFVIESSDDEDHQDSHVTLIIPYLAIDSNRLFAVRFSMNWSAIQSNL